MGCLLDRVLAVQFRLDILEKKMTEKISVTINEASEMLGLGRSTIYRLINSGDLKPRKVGKRTLFIVSELREFICSK